MRQTKTGFLFLLATFLAFGNIFAQETAKSHVEKGIKYANMKKYNEAIVELNKAIELNPNYADAYYNRGLAYDFQNNHDQAIFDFSKAIELNPAGTVYYNRAIAYCNKQEWNNAWEDVYRAEALGFKVNPDFLAQLKKDSGREK